MTHRLINIAMAIAFVAAWMTVAGMFDRQLMEGDLRHSKDAQVERRKNEAAIKICGNSFARWEDQATLVCRRHDGHGKSVVTSGVQL